MTVNVDQGTLDHIGQCAHKKCTTSISLVSRTVSALFLGFVLVACGNASLSAQEEQNIKPAAVTDPYSIEALVRGKKVPVSGYNSKLDATRAYYLGALSDLCLDDDLKACERFVEEKRRLDISAGIDPHVAVRLRDPPQPAAIKLRDHYQKLCNSKNGKACYELSEMIYLEFNSVDADPMVVGPYQRLRLQSCDLGYEKACEYIETTGAILDVDYDAHIRANSAQGR